MTEDSTNEVSASGVARARRGALWLLFASVLLIPKAIGWRRHPRTWNRLRVVAALLGCGCLAVGFVAGREWRIAWIEVMAIMVGCLLVLLSLVVTPATPPVVGSFPGDDLIANDLRSDIESLGAVPARDSRQPIGSVPSRQTAGASSDLIDARARALGAYVVVDGGRYRTGRESVAALLFVGPQRIWALDTGLQAMIAIPVAQITRVLVEGTGEEWVLRLVGESLSVEFLYSGAFAEHFARVAETTIHSQLFRELTILR